MLETTEERHLSHGDPTRLSAGDLARLLRAGDLSAREVVDAHISRIEACDDRVNALAFKRFDAARAEASEADGRRERGEPLGPLHGVPITVKECFEMAGTPSCVGIRDWAGRMAAADSPLVTRLREAGAIVLGKGNLSQLMISIECDNPVYGPTRNPWDPARSPGGSSGGDGAVVASGGVPLALGSDIGGSLRIPAHVCGVHTLKPTTGRLTMVGSTGILGRQEAIRAQPGPLARTVPDVALMMQILAAPGLAAVDPAVPPVPWSDPAAIDPGSLRIGYYEDDGYFTPAPALRRAVREAAGALESRGARVESWTPPDMRHAVDLFLGLMSADGGAHLGRVLGDGPRDMRVEALEQIARLKRPLRSALAWYAGRRGQHSVVPLVRGIREYSVDEYWGLLEARKHYLARILAQLDERGLDAIICPPSPLPALPHGTSIKLGAVYCYTAYYNVLGLPAGVVAATRVRPDEESDRPASADRAYLVAKQVEQGSAGLPVGVQVVARPWREDVVLSVMAALEDHFRRQPGYPERAEP